MLPTGRYYLPVVTLLLVCLATPVSAGLQKYIRFERYSMADGLSNNGVYSIAQDRAGFMWFATENGLNRFDGYEFSVFRHDPNDPMSLPDNQCRVVFVDRPGRVWIGTQQGLALYDERTETFQRFQHDPEDPTSISDDRVVMIKETRDGLILVGSEGGGLSILDTRTGIFRNIRHDPDNPDSLSPGVVMDFHQTADGSVWLGARAGQRSGSLDRLDPSLTSIAHVVNTCDSGSTNCTAPGPEHLSSGIERIYEDRDGRIWLSAGGVSLFDPTTGKLTHFRHDPDDPTSVSNNTVLPIIQDRRGNFWVGTYFGGFNRFYPDTGTFDRYRNIPTDLHSLGPDPIFSLFEAADGTIWIGFVGRDWGLNKFHPGTLDLAHYKHDPDDPDSLSSNRITDVVAGEDGSLWMSTPRSGLNRVDLVRGTVQRFEGSDDDPARLPAGRISALFVDSHGTLWAGMTGGRISRHEEQTRTFSTMMPHRELGSPQVIAEAPDGAMWFGGTGGLMRYDPDSEGVRVFAVDNDDPNALHGETGFLSMSFGDENEVWTIGWGLQRLDAITGSVTHFVHDEADPDSIAHNQVNRLYVDEHGRFWLSTALGLDIFDPRTQKFERFARNDLFEGTRPVEIFIDPDDDLWVTTLTGELYRIDLDTLAYERLDAMGGLAGGTAAVGITPLESGMIVANGTDGFNIIDPNRIGRQAQPPPIVLTDFSLFNRPVAVSTPEIPTPLPESLDTASAIVLTHRDYLFSLRFSALDFTNPTDTGYEYMLDGFDDKWITSAADQRVATYTNVPPGNYRFRVRATDSSGNWHEMARDFRVMILPPPWATWWAYMLYVTAAVLAIVLVVRARTVSLVNRARYLDAEVAKRTREIENNELMIRHQADRLEETLEAKNRLYANISHEFRTPLTLILGPVGQLLKGQSSADVASKLRVVKENGQRLLRLVDQLLNLSRLSAGEPVTHSPQPLGGIANSIVESFRPLASERGLRLKLEEENELWVRCAPDALEKILLNLISNAIKYTPQGGYISVSIVAEESDMVRLSVSDSGIGISAEEQHAVFDRFYRAHGNGGETNPGAGLGLALVKELAEAAGGTVELTSQPGQGTTVAVLFPRHHVGPDDKAATRGAELSEQVELELTSSRQATSVAAIDQAEGAYDRPSILIIEDNADMQNYIMALMAETYDAEAVADGESGIRIAVAQVPDVVICDVMLPGIDGFEVSKTLKSDDATSHIPIVMLTGRGDHDSRMKGLRQHVDDYLTKPFDDEELMLRIENLLSAKERFKQRYSRLRFDDIELAADPRPRENRFLVKLQTIVEANYSDHEFRVERLASAMAMSDRQLQRKLKALVNRSPSEYLRGYRLAKARSLLRDGMGVGLVADVVGFSSQAYFSSCFRAAFGCSPTEFRKQQDERLRVERLRVGPTQSVDGQE